MGGDLQKLYCTAILTASLHSTIMWTLCQKANNTLAFLRRNLKHYHQRVKLDAYKIFVLPILNYAVTIWSPHTHNTTTLWDYIFSGMAETAELVETAEMSFTDYGHPSPVSCLLLYKYSYIAWSL